VEVQIPMEDTNNKYALAFKALSDENRLLIIDYLMSGEQCACRILEQLRISQPTLSHHMKILCDSDLVKVRKDGKWMHYSINRTKFEQLKEVLENYTKVITRQDPECNC
jgi:ArsR family transcriptional regulator, arsenate/arsenite/antimonite-responsive transcriptional repressor